MIIGRTTLAAACVAAWLAAKPAGAGAQETLALTLAEAIARGLEASHRIGELDARRTASEAAVQSSRAPGLPQLAVLGGYTRTNHVEEFAVPQPGPTFEVIYPDAPDNWRSRLDLQWSVYNGGRIDSLTRAAEAEARAAGSDIDAARTDLRLEITRAYWNLVTARDAVTVVERSLDRVDAHLADARARFDAGFVPPSDVASAEAQRSLQQALLIEARNASRIANLALARLVNVPLTTAIEPVEAVAAPLIVPPSADVLLQEARRTREDRRALETRIAAAAERVRAAGAQSRPAIVLAGGVDYARPNPHIFPRVEEWNDSWDVSVNASWSLFDGGRTRADAAGATASERAMRKRLDEFDSVLDFEVRQRWFEVDSSRARVTAAEDAVRSAAEARRVLQDRYLAGVATSIDVVDAQTVLLEAELQRTRAIAAVRVAEAALDRAVGR